MSDQHQNQLIDRNGLDHLNRPAHRNRPDGFTLVELMAVIVIIGILTALVLGAMRGALIDSQTAKTRGTIAKIDAVLNEKMDEYLSKPLKFLDDAYMTLTGVTSATNAPFIRREFFPTENNVLNPTVQRLPDTNWASRTRTGTWWSTQVPSTGLLKERVRLGATRDLMRMEMPDCVADLFAAGFARPASATAPPVYPSTYLRNPVTLATGFGVGASGTALPGTVQRIVQQLQPPTEFQRIVARVWEADKRLSGTERWCTTFANEELLYLIVEGSYVGSSPAIEVFAANEIADTDNDGLFEFIDAWGTPIRWLRWPTGVDSVAPFEADPFSTTAGTDAFDPAQADMGFDPVQTATNALPGFTPRPMVVSAGPDRRFGLRFHPVVPSGSGFVTSGNFSVSSRTLTGATTPRRPGYWPFDFNFPDPFWPRDNSGARLGAVAITTIDTTFDPIGVDLSVTPPTLIANPNTDLGIYSTNDEFYQGVSQDNVSNLDESGASL